MKLLQAALAGLAVGVAGLAVTPSKAEPLYRYCMIGTPNSYTSCTFNTLQQCQLTASAGAGFCIESNTYVASRQGAPIRR
jgi:hypothetical protein